MKALPKTGILALMLTSIVFLMTACNTDGKYEVKNGKVFFTYWTVSFGTQRHELKDVDAASFQSMKDWLGRDAHHVWFKDRLVKSAHPASAEPMEYPLFRDRRDYYYKGAPLHVKDLATFTVKKCEEREFWATDSQYIYYDSLRIEGSDPATFEYLEFYKAKDRLHVYYNGKILPDADPASYVAMGTYSKDKSHVWYCGELMEGADPATFEAEETLDSDKPDAHDKNRQYRYGKVFEQND